MKNCQPFVADLDAYRDQTLARSRQREVAAHVDSCEHCQAELDRAARIESAIRSTAQDWHPAAGLWGRIIDSAASPTGSTPIKSSRPVLWASAAMLLLTVAVTGITLLKDTMSTDSNRVAAALVNEFHTFVVSHRELDFTDSEPDQIRSWFSDKVDFRVPLPVRQPGIKLTGGRLCNMLEQRVASFMYQADGAWVSLYIMRSVADAQGRSASHEVLLKGYGYIDWENQGLHYSLVGDLPVQRLREIAKQLRSTRILTELPNRPAQRLYISSYPTVITQSQNRG